MTALQSILSSAPAVHYCAGKLDGVIVALLEAEPGNVFGSHSVVVADANTLRQLPIQPETEARATYWTMVRQLNAASI